MVRKHALYANTHIASNTEIFNIAAWMSDALWKYLLLLFCIRWLLSSPIWASHDILFERSVKVGNRKTIEWLFTLGYFWQFNLLSWIGRWILRLWIFTCELRGWRFEKLIIKSQKLKIIFALGQYTSTTKSRGCRSGDTRILQWRRCRFLNWHWTWISSRLEAGVDVVVVISRLIIIHEWKHGGLSCFEFFEIFIEIQLLLLKIKLDVAFLYVVIKWGLSTAILHYLLLLFLELFFELCFLDL